MSLADVLTVPAAAREAVTRGLAAIPAAAAFAAVFAAALAACAAGGLILAEQAAGTRFRTIVVVFAACGFGAGLPAWILSSAVAGHRGATARFAAMLTLLAAGTAAALALAQFAAYTLDEPDRNIRILSMHNAFMLASRAAASVYVTLATGLRFVLPQGLPLLFAGALAFAAWSGRRRD